MLGGEKILASMFAGIITTNLVATPQRENLTRGFFNL